MLGVLWITGLRPCGLEEMWISGLGECGGCGSPTSLPLSTHLSHIFSTLAVLCGAPFGVFCVFCAFSSHMQCFVDLCCAVLSVGGHKKVAEGGPSATKKVIVGVISRVLYPFGCQSFN